MRANHIVYRGLQPHAAADATVSEKEACGLLVEKDTRAYAELTRSIRAAYAPELTAGSKVVEFASFYWNHQQLAFTNNAEMQWYRIHVRGETQTPVLR